MFILPDRRAVRMSLSASIGAALHRSTAVDDSEVLTRPTIALLAYQLWEDAGLSEGRGDEFYIRAEQGFRQSLENPQVNLVDRGTANEPPADA
jgi:hypothetical protein